MTTYTPEAKRQSYGDQTCAHCGQLRQGHHPDGHCFTEDELIERLQSFQRSKRDQRLFDQMASALRMAYLKHHLEDESIGWNELSDILLNALTEAMGDRPFQKWLEEQRQARARMVSNSYGNNPELIRSREHRR